VHQVDRTGPVAGRSLAAGVAGRRSRAAAGRTADWGRGTAGAARAVGRESGCGWHHSPGRTGPGEHRNRAAGELDRTGRAQVVGTDSVYLLAAAYGVPGWAQSVRIRTHLLLRIGAMALTVLVVLRLTIGWRRRVLLLLLVVATVALLLLMCAVVAVALAAVVVVTGHGDCVW
jgi:hypothetical protein